MNLHWIDWLIVVSLLGFICVSAYSTRQYMRSVADFLSANRCAGKYLLGVADGIAGLGAISIVARFEMHYKAGFTAAWWDMMLLPIGVIVAATGWVQYRFRQTRAMTMAQFFEMRYSRSFRIYAGVMGCLSGIVNFGIFPAVGGRFFQHYCGFPEVLVDVGGLQIDVVYALIMLVLLGISLGFTFLGGQIAVMVTDFFQGIFVNAVFAVMGVFLLFFLFDWSHILEAAAMAPPDASLINPLKTSNTDNFNVNYFLIQAFGAVYVFMAWQGNQGYYGAARSPHDARMGRLIGQLRPITQTLPLVLLPMGAWAFLHHPDFAAQAASAKAALGLIESDQIRSQLTVTVATAHFLPPVILGLFAAVMLAAFISTHDTYLHAWGSIFIQDVVMPIRQSLVGDKVLTPAAHIRLLKFSIFGVAVFIFLFSLLFSQQQDILMFFALTGTIYLGWAGAAIVGGLYWSRGTNAGAWWAAVAGVILAFAGWYFTYFWEDARVLLQGVAPQMAAADKMPVNAQILWFWTMVATLVTYVVVSLISGAGKPAFNMDQLLHRGRYAVRAEAAVAGEGGTVGSAGEASPGSEAAPAAAAPRRGLAIFAMGPEFTFGDRVLFVFAYAYLFVVAVLFVAGTTYMLSTDVSDAAWGRFWWGYSLVMLTLTVVVTVWVAVGGVRNLREMFATLHVLERDDADDGTVVGHRSLSDIEHGVGGEAADAVPGG